MLFNLYLNEIPFLLDKQDTDPILLPNGSSLNCLLYADDLILISRWADGLKMHFPCSPNLQQLENEHQHQNNKSHYISKET